MRRLSGEEQMQLIENYRNSIARLEKFEKYVDKVRIKIIDHDYKNYNEVKNEIDKLVNLNMELTYNNIVDKEFYKYQSSNDLKIKNEKRIDALKDKINKAKKDIWLIVNNDLTIRKKPQPRTFNDNDYDI
jgi:hypothetical protein